MKIVVLAGGLSTERDVSFSVDLRDHGGVVENGNAAFDGLQGVHGCGHGSRRSFISHVPYRVPYHPLLLLPGIAVAARLHREQQKGYGRRQ